MRLSEDQKMLENVGVKDIINGTFIIPIGVTQVGSEAFRDCTTLTKITIPNHVTEIGTAAFMGCLALEEVAIPPSVTRIGQAAFLNCCALTEIIIPPSVTKLALYTFKDCHKLTGVMIPANITYIGISAFENCHALTEISLPASVTKIDAGAFAYCGALKKIIIPADVTEIGGAVFLHCHALTQIIINTDSDEVLDRLKSLLPPRFVKLAMKNPVYNKVIEQNKALCQFFANSLQGEHKAFYALLIHHTLRINKNRLYLAHELTNLIASFDEKSHQFFKNKIYVLSIPTNEQELQSYITKSQELFKISSCPIDTVREEAEMLLSQENMAAINCKAKLTTYCLYIEKQKEIKRKKQPTFFSDNESLSMEIEAKLQAVKKVIDFLGENKASNFTPKNMSYLESGFINDCLNEYDILLPQANSNIYTFYNFLHQSVVEFGSAVLDLMYAISAFVADFFDSSSQDSTQKTQLIYA